MPILMKKIREQGYCTADQLYTISNSLIKRGTKTYSESDLYTAVSMCDSLIDKKKYYWTIYDRIKRK